MIKKKIRKNKVEELLSSVDNLTLDEIVYFCEAWRTKFSIFDRTEDRKKYLDELAS